MIEFRELYTRKGRRILQDSVLGGSTIMARKRGLRPPHGETEVIDRWKRRSM
jgi:hypothetical protein